MCHQWTKQNASFYSLMMVQAHSKKIPISADNVNYHLSQNCRIQINKNLASYMGKKTREYKNILKASNLSLSVLSEKPYNGLFGSNGESHESFSAESLSPAPEMWVIKIAFVDWGTS